MFMTRVYQRPPSKDEAHKANKPRRCTPDGEFFPEYVHSSFVQKICSLHEGFLIRFIARQVDLGANTNVMRTENPFVLLTLESLTGKKLLE